MNNAPLKIMKILRTASLWSNCTGSFKTRMYYEKSMFKASGRLLFSLFIINQYCKPKMLLL